MTRSNCASTRLPSIFVRTFWTCGRRLRRGFLCALCAILPAQPSAAINIVMQLQQEGMNPNSDPTGFGLKAIADAAAVFWEEYLPGSGNYEVDIWWDTEEVTGNIWGQWSFQSGGDNNIRINADPRDAGNNPVQWFFDPTPDEHTEFDFTTQNRVLNMPGTQWIYRGGQWLYRDLDPLEQVVWFGGNPPDVMEVGYRGFAIGMGLQQQADLLSTVIHEIGHELGVNETGGPWEADPAWLPGGSATFFEDAGADHLAAQSSLMCAGCGLPGTRRMPSAVDIMAAADDEGMMLIDLPRQDYIGDGTWHTLFHWTGAIPPDAEDEAFLRDQNNVSLTSNATIETLWISHGSDLSVQPGNTLTVTGQTTVSDVGGAGQLVLAQNATADLETLLVVGSDVRLLGGLIDVADDLVLTPDGVIDSTLAAYGGMVRVGGQLINDGEIVAFDNVTAFTFNFTPTDRLDLDGSSETGEVKALAGSIILDAEMADAFDGDMLIDDGQSIATNYDWTLGSKGVLRLVGTSSDPAVIDGPAETMIRGAVNVGVGVMATNETRFESTAAVTVANSGDRLILETDAYFAGGSYTGKGAIEQQDDVYVQADTTIETGVYDWGNSAGLGVNETTIEEDVVFTVSSKSTGTPDNEYRGTIRLNNGVLDVQTAAGWTLPTDLAGVDGSLGTLLMHNNPEYRTIPQLRGRGITLGGVLRATGDRGEIQTTLVTRSSAEIDVQTAASLSLEDHVTYDSPLIHGDGTLVQNADADVISSTTIGTKVFDWDGDEGGPSDMNIAAGAALTINSQRIEAAAPATDGYDGHVTVDDSGALIVITNGPWRLDGTMTLEGQTVATPGVIVDGSELINYGTIKGNGRIQTNVENHGTLSPGLSAGALRFDVGLTLAPDGVVAIEIGGLTPLTQYDRIIVNQFGTANLGGDLAVSLLNGFVPPADGLFTILTAGLASGVFDHELKGALPPGLNYKVAYNPTSVVLSFLAGFTADFDMDGDVDADDIAQWQASYGVDDGGDANGDGITDGADYLILQQQLGGSLPAMPAADAVPEPSAAALAAAAVGVLVAWRRITGTHLVAHASLR